MCIFYCPNSDAGWHKILLIIIILKQQIWNICNTKKLSLPKPTLYHNAVWLQSFRTLSKKIILITGASSGIGETTAKEIASATKGDIKLILTARRKQRLETLSEVLSISITLSRFMLHNLIFPRLKLLVHSLIVCLCNFLILMY